MKVVSVIVLILISYLSFAPILGNFPEQNNQTNNCCKCTECQVANASVTTKIMCEVLDLVVKANEDIVKTDSKD